jgi:hypothetical protein
MPAVGRGRLRVKKPQLKQGQLEKRLWLGEFATRQTTRSTSVVAHTPLANLEVVENVRLRRASLDQSTITNTAAAPRAMNCPLLLRRAPLQREPWTP